MTTWRTRGKQPRELSFGRRRVSLQLYAICLSSAEVIPPARHPCLTQTQRINSAYYLSKLAGRPDGPESIPIFDSGAYRMKRGKSLGTCQR